MTEFEILSVPIFFVLGLGVTKILGAVGSTIRRREQTKLHWLPFAWVFVILLFQIQFFSVLWGFHEDERTWTWMSYVPILFHPFLYFLSATLILPTQRDDSVDSLLADFDKHGKLAVIAIGITLFTAIVFNVYVGGSTWSEAMEANILNVILTALIVVVVTSSTRRYLQAAATIAFIVVQLYGILSVWTRPGVAL